MRRRGRLVTAGVLGAVVGLAPAPVLAGDEVAPDPRIFAPGERPGGRSYPAVAGDWVEWLLEIPVAGNPGVNPSSGRGCASVGRFVFTGPSGTGDRTCVVPRGRLVALSFAGFECSTAEGDGETFRELRRCAARGWRETFNPRLFRFRMVLDGQRVQRPRRWTMTTANRVADLPRRNLFGGRPGPTRTSSRGLFYVLRPLSPGLHVLRVRGTDAEFGEFDWVWRFRVR